MFSTPLKLLIVFHSWSCFLLLLVWLLLIYSLITYFPQEHHSLSSWILSTSLLCLHILSVVIISILGSLGRPPPNFSKDLLLSSSIPHCDSNCSPRLFFSFLSFPSFFSFFCFCFLFYFILFIVATHELSLCLFSTNGTLSL